MRKLGISFEEAIDKMELSVNDRILLPICHNTQEGAFFDIQQMHVIEPQYCEKYKEKLSYFFYGKPAYISKHAGLDTLTDDLPIVLIFDLRSVPNAIHRLLPFDSGGFDRYNIKGGFRQDHFTIEKPTKEKLLKLVKCVFTNNTNYLNSHLQVAAGNDVISQCKALDRYIRQIRSAFTHGGQFGERAFTFELQYKDDIIQFNPLAILVHQSFFSLDQWQSQIEKYAENGIDLYAYGKEGQAAMELRKAYDEIEVKVHEIILNQLNA